MQSFSPLRITCSVITLGLCLTTASVGVNTAYASPVHNPARQQGVYMQSQTNLRHTSITQELPFVAAAEVRAQKHLDTSRTDSANSFEHTLAHMPSSPVSTDDKSVSKPSGKHFASSDANTVQVNTKSVERKNGRQGSIQNVGSKDSKDSKSIQDSKLTQDVRAQNQMLFADRSAQAPYDVRFNLQYKLFSSEMTYFQKWESGHNYDHGFGAGDSYNALGAYQFDRRDGLATFMKQVYNYDPQTFYMLSAVGEKYNWDFSTYDVFDKASGTFTQFGDDLNQAWHSAYAASPDVFSRLQDYYAYYNYYAASDGVKRSLSYFGVDPDERSDSFKSLVWGMANLFGKGGGIYSLRAGNYWGCNKFFKLANIDGSMNDAQLIAAICDAVIDNVKNIYPSQQIYWQGWINRYTDEKAHYLSLSIGSWQLDSHGWYYVDSTGRTVKGWFNAVNGKRWYADPSTGYAIFGDCVVRGYHYWIDSGYGLQYNSWIDNQDGTRMRTDGLGRLIKGWYKDSSGSCFYFDSNFKMTLGKVSVEGKDYWLDKDRGLLYNEWVKDESGKWLHTDGNGCLVKGWYHAPNGKWFYFNKDSYQMVTGKLTDDHKDYWLDENAGLLYDRWVQDSRGNWLHTDDNGCLVKGWFYTSNGKLFYFNDDYRMVTGELTYKGKIYSLDPQEGLVSVKDIPIRHTQAYEDGAFAFFKAKGATRALEILNKADYASFTNKGNPNDATAVKNMLASIPEMKVCNALRARHGLKPLRVTYELVAMAMSDANWSSSNIAHAQQFNVGENLAWYREKPFTGWYDQEKALYDADPVKNKAAAGHYLNIIRETYECTGFAIATYANNEYRKPCFGQTFLWETNDSKSMTVDEYERELTQWVKSTQA